MKKEISYYYTVENKDLEFSVSKRSTIQNSEEDDEKEAFPAVNFPPLDEEISIL